MNVIGRRIKRFVDIDRNTIRVLDHDEIARFTDFALLRDYVEQKQKELKASAARAVGNDFANHTRSWR